MNGRESGESGESGGSGPGGDDAAAAVRLPGSSLRLWFWMPAAALLAVVLPILTPIWLAGGLSFAVCVVAFGIVTGAALGGVLVGIVTRRRLLSRGGAAAAGVAVTMISYLLYGEVAFATGLLLSRMGYIDPHDPDLQVGWINSMLVPGFLALWLTWWFTLPVGAGAGLLAWLSAVGRMRHRRTRRSATGAGGGGEPWTES